MAETLKPRTLQYHVYTTVMSEAADDAVTLRKVTSDRGKAVERAREIIAGARDMMRRRSIEMMTDCGVCEVEEMEIELDAVESANVSSLDDPVRPYASAWGFDGSCYAVDVVPVEVDGADMDIAIY